MVAVKKIKSQRIGPALSDPFVTAGHTLITKPALENISKKKEKRRKNNER
jgi:hypothetical protein